MNVFIADDHDIVIRGLKDLLTEAYGDIDFTEARDGLQVQALLGSRRWDLMLLDVIMPGLNIIDTLHRIRMQDSDVPVLILTAAAEAEYAVRTIKAGANGYISKQHVATELVAAVEKVLNGGTYLSSQAVEALAAGLRNKRQDAPHEALSSRELQVLKLIASGKAVKEIAYELSLSAKTIGTYVARIREKTGLDNYVEMALYAVQHDLLD